jgi:cytochrome c553
MRPLVGATLGLLLVAPAVAAPPQDTLAQRLIACTACHGPQGRAAPDGYHPRIAGKPALYLFNQLVNFREGRRRYGPMVYMVDHLGDAYLREIAEHFAAIELPYAAPAPASDAPALLAFGQTLAMEGDPARRLPACAACHGRALTGVAPAIPGLLGLPRDYLKGQLGAWANGQRRAHAPDCMADIARALTPQDVSAVTAWLADSLPPPLPKRRGIAPR